MDQNWLDIQHRGFTAYLGETADADACKKLNRAVTGTDKAGERMDTVLLDCEVDTDWIERIETALPFIENAVRQNRQFILRQGQTVPIEKAKRVSRASVEHLSRHSELITTEPEPGGDLLPDRLYMTENVGTYTVYENRFLYMLLCLIRDFAGSRYRRINELAASFCADISLDKQLNDGTREIRYCLRFSETSHSTEGSAAEAAIGRIRGVLQAVELLLRTDLMKEVAEVPLLKPPVARTNVLLHDPNFKAAFELYSFLADYNGVGYSRIERYRNAGAVPDENRGDLAALISVTSYLSHRCGGLLEELEERRRAEDERAARERVAALKERLGPLEPAAAAYIIELEQRNAELEGREDRLLEQQRVSAGLQNRLDEMDRQMGQLRDETAGLEDALSEREREIGDLTKKNEQVCEELAGIKQNFEAEFQRQKQEFLREYEMLKEKYVLACAQSRPLSDGEECCTPEAFAELEAQYRAFKRYYERQWKLTKKQIRKEKLWKR